MTVPTKPTTIRFHVTGMDCSDCAAKIEKATRPIPGVSNVKVSTATQIMTLTADRESVVEEVNQAVSQLGYRLALMADGADDDDLPKNLSHITPAYKRALWIVVALNVGYGIVEIIGGFQADSQALKADALDFLGDGLITFLGLLAIGWSFRWRARSALLQGVFLAVLGLGVLGTTVYRIFVLQTPEAGLMGVYGLIALVVNVSAALVLIPHRSGDANVRAVWLFSRNDALGNVAVVAAAALVAWTASPWPDLVVAAVIAGLFLHSAWEIIGDARNDLKRNAKAKS